MSSIMKDIAKRCGVSITTVSRALRGSDEISKDTKKRILEVAKELDYTTNIPARVLAGGRSNTIGLIVADNSNPFFAKLILGIEDIAKKNNFGVILYNTNEDPELEMHGHRMLNEKRVDGLLITSMRTGKEPLISLQKKGIPFVLLNRYIEDLETDWVRSDNVHGAYNITSLLCSLGHKRILHITGGEEISSVKERITGYKNALSEHNIEFNPDLIYRCNLKLEGGYQCTKCAISDLKPLPTAIFAYSDVIAVGVMKTLSENHLKIPDDIALVGYDNIEYSEFLEPSLTTVDQFAFEIGQKGMEILIEKICYPEDRTWEKRQIIIKPEIQIRESSGDSRILKN
jgi:LacI family transcriptional regulator